MSATIPSLWPDDIRVDILPPLVLLKVQAAKIGELTRGVLDAEVTTVTGQSDFVVHRLDLIAPELDDSRYRILSATHRSEFYPVVIEAEVFRPRPKKIPLTAAFAAQVVGPLALGVPEVSTDPDRWPHPDDWRPVASSQEEFVDRLREVLRSPPVRATIDSLLARSYEKTLTSQNGEASSGEGASS